MLLMLAVSSTGCGEQSARASVIGFGDPHRGARLIQQYRCGACHRIPGIRNAVGRVAPPLDFFSERTFIAGQVPNTPSNLVRWVSDPSSIERGTAMPTLGLSADEARDVAAYLYTLH